MYIINWFGIKQIKCKKYRKTVISVNIKQKSNDSIYRRIENWDHYCIYDTYSMHKFRLPTLNNIFTAKFLEIRKAINYTNKINEMTNYSFK